MLDISMTTEISNMASALKPGASLIKACLQQVPNMWIGNCLYKQEALVFIKDVYTQLNTVNNVKSHLLYIHLLLHMQAQLHLICWLPSLRLKQIIQLETITCLKLCLLSAH